MRLPDPVFNEDRCHKISTIDAHTGGEPLRLIVDGLPPLEGRAVLEKRRFMRENLDHFRTALMWEPRGHADMYGAVLTEPETADGHFGVIFLHNEGYSTMCGHGIIALATILLETRMVPSDGESTELRFDTPAGRVTATTHMEGSRVSSVSFRNVPSFVYRRNVVVGGQSFDIAFGGAYYAIGPAPKGLEIASANAGELIFAGRHVKQQIASTTQVVHPFEPDLGFLYGVIFTGPPVETGHHSRNVCIFADGEVDRSPTGTGVSARAALHFADGDIGVGEPIVIESILGSTFQVEAVEEVKFGAFDAIVPKVTGSAFLTGTSEFVIDLDDPLRGGFLVR